MKNKKLIGLIRNDYAFSILVKIMMIVVGVLHSSFLARFLGAELKGVATTILSTVALLQVIITCGIHQAYPYFKREGRIERFTEIFVNNVYFLYTTMFVLAVIGAVVCRNAISSKYIFVLLLTPLFAYETVINYVYLIENPLRKNFWSLLSSLFETIFILLLWVTVKPNVFYMVLAISMAILVRAVAATVGLHVKWNPRQISARFIGKMLRFGILPMLALILTVMNSKIDVLMMDWSPSITSAAIGLYSVGLGFADKILSIPDAIREILLSRLVAGKSEQEVARVTRLSFFFCIIMASGFALLGKPLLHILYGTEYAGAYRVLVIAAFGTGFMVFLKMISQYNVVNKRQMANLLMLAVSVVTNIVFNLILMPIYGIEGAAFASFIGHLVCALCFVLYFSKVTKIRPVELIVPQKDDFSLLLHRGK